MTNANEETMKQETVGELFVRRMEDMGITTSDLAARLMFSSHNVVAMIRSGRMRLPLNRVIMACKVLEVDPIYMLRLLASEMVETSNDDRLLEVLTIVMEQEPLTAGEWEMVKLYRKYTHSREVMLSEDFKDEFAMITMALEDVKNKVSTNVEAFKARRILKRRGPQPGYTRKRKVVEDLTMPGEPAGARRTAPAAELVEPVEPVEPQLTPEDAFAKKLAEEQEELRALAALRNK